MIKIYSGVADRKLVLERNNAVNREAEKTVREIIDAVRIGGDEAIRRYALKFDGAALTDFEVTKSEFEEARKTVSDAFVQVIRRAKRNIEEFHLKQRRQGFEIKRENGAVLGQKITPLERVGIYVPGGTASYPSTVLMNAIPAKIAGVKEIIMVTPVKKDGKVRAEILVAAEECGVDRVFRIGGAQAVAALAYGTETVPKADKITGPGNIFVAAAKKELYGVCGIDMIAGPSEILIIADGTAKAAFIAADMLSQAEHDANASAVLITTEEKLAYEVRTELERRIPLLERESAARQSIDNNGRIITVKDIAEALKLADELAPEHLELCVENPFAALGKIKNAGSVFLGNYTPESVGDYYAGTNHTLPTGGNARFSSPLSVDDFVKKTSYIMYPEQALYEAKDDIALFAEKEGLQAHALAALERFKDEQIS